MESEIIEWLDNNKKRSTIIEKIDNSSINSYIIGSFQLINEEFNYKLYYPNNIHVEIISSNMNLINDKIADYNCKINTKWSLHLLLSSLNQFIEELNFDTTMIDSDEEWEDYEIDNKRSITDGYNQINYIDILNSSLNKKEVDIVVKDHIECNFTAIQIIHLIYNELLEITKLDNISVSLIDNNIFTIIIKYSDIKFRVELNSKYYPYYPPYISILEPVSLIHLTYDINKMDYFKIKTWNPTNTLTYLVINLCNIFNERDRYEDKSIDCHHELINILYELAIVGSLSVNKQIYLDPKMIKFIDLTKNNDLTKNKYQGIGYGYGNDRSKFDLNSYLQSNEIIDDNIEKLVNKINRYLSNINDKIDMVATIMKNSCFIDLINKYFYNIDIVYIENNVSLYRELLKLLSNDIYYKLNLLSGSDIINTFSKLKDNLDKYDVLVPELSHFTEILDDICEIYCTDRKISLNTDICNQYIDYLQAIQIDIINDFDCQNRSFFEGSTVACNRIKKELTSLFNDLPLTWDSSIFLRVDENNLTNMKFLIIGPKDTPYQNGCYEFNLKLGSTYPLVAPKCEFLTTNGGTYRFNPNLYANGKVCLSLLGTWTGHDSESWNPASSNLLQIFLSIQSLILCEEPYYNEPGYELRYGSKQSEIASIEYNKNIQYMNFKVAILDVLKNPSKNFEEIIINHFKYKKNEIIEQFNNHPLLTNELEEFISILDTL